MVARWCNIGVHRGTEVCDNELRNNKVCNDEDYDDEVYRDANRDSKVGGDEDSDGRDRDNDCRDNEVRDGEADVMMGGGDERSLNHSVLVRCRDLHTRMVREHVIVWHRLTPCISLPRAPHAYVLQNYYKPGKA